jgi:hypothetical protein
LLGRGAADFAAEGAEAGTGGIVSAGAGTSGAISGGAVGATGAAATWAAPGSEEDAGSLVALE